MAKELSELRDEYFNGMAQYLEELLALPKQINGSVVDRLRRIYVDGHHKEAAKICYKIIQQIIEEQGLS